MKRYEPRRLGHVHEAREPHLPARVLELHHGKQRGGASWNVVDWNDVAERFDGARSLVSSVR